ncbi:MAG: hypothetical protein ABW133_04435, partial [Polyangiaceae bacterium]
MNWKMLSIAAGLLMSSACGGTDEGVGPEKSYTEMSFEERALFMNDVVLPKMKATFTAFDPKFANLSCGSCHAEGVSSGAYKMPSSDLVRLPGSEEEFLEYVKDPEHARWAQFMMDKVWPEMAGILKVKMFDPEHGSTEGFSC